MYIRRHQNLEVDARPGHLEEMYSGSRTSLLLKDITGGSSSESIHVDATDNQSVDRRAGATDKRL